MGQGLISKFGKGTKFNGVDQGAVVLLPHELGDELLENGDFETDLSGWESVSGGVLAHGDGNIEIRRDGDGNGYPKARSASIVATANKTFIIKYKCVSSTSGAYEVYLERSREGGTQTQNITPIGELGMLIVNVTGDEKLIIGGSGFDNENTDDVVVFDNISVKEITQEELHLYNYNNATDQLDYQHITTPTPYYDLGKVDGTGDYEDKIAGLMIATKTEFTPEQLEYQYKYPEKFLYRENEILKSFILGQTEIDNVVSYVPMVDSDDYCRDLVSYSEGVERINNGDFSEGDASWSISGHSVIEEGVANIISKSGDFTYILQADVVEIGVSLIEFDITESNTGELKVGTGSKFEFQNLSEVGHYAFIVSSTEVKQLRFARQVDEVDIKFDNVSVKLLTGINPIQNYTDACRDEATNLTKGLQTSKWHRDSFGLPTGYADKGLVLDGTVAPALSVDMTDTELYENGEFTIEFVVSREHGLDTQLLYTRSGQVGIRVWGNYGNDRIAISLYDGSSASVIYYAINEDYHHIAFVVTPTHMTMYVDNVEIDTVEHSFVPSGMNFKDSTKLSPKGELRLFKLYKKAMSALEVDHRYNDAQLKGLL